MLELRSNPKSILFIYEFIYLKIIYIYISLFLYLSLFYPFSLNNTIKEIEFFLGIVCTKQ